MSETNYQRPTWMQGAWSWLGYSIVWGAVGVIGTAVVNAAMKAPSLEGTIVKAQQECTTTSGQSSLAKCVAEVFNATQKSANDGNILHSSEPSNGIESLDSVNAISFSINGQNVSLDVRHTQDCGDAAKPTCVRKLVFSPIP